MDASLSHTLKDQREKPGLLVKVASLEKQLWILILTKGPLHSEVQELYHKICCSYENIILSDRELAEVQDVEYSLWKLHYRHIDEFRKRIKGSSVHEETTKTAASQSAVSSQRSSEDHVERLKSFLSEATEFYQKFMIKLKKSYGLSEGFSFCKNGANSSSVDKKKIQKLQFLCHRILICLGDLARYREQCEKSDTQFHNWSVAGKHYLEATMIWPDSGNPHNQLAVLATYVGDDFLALYHCIRSLAVKEPFPDAWNNLILLFERNRSSYYPSLSHDAHFDFLKPSESSLQSESQLTNDLSERKMVKSENEGCRETNPWPLIVRVISFFFIKSSLDDFPCTFASAMKELEKLMELDDTEIKAAVESYQLMGLARSGPVGTLQFVSIFIFVIDNLINSPEVKDLNNDNYKQQIALTQVALASTFIFMGRLVDRCLNANMLDSCPLLPAILVFVEWLVGILDEAETYETDERCTSAVSYFFGAFLELLLRLDKKRGDMKALSSTTLWEDYELRGFAPLAHLHLLQEFSSNWEHSISFESGFECRALRMINAAIKIADRPSSNCEWIFYNKSEKKFSILEPKRSLDRKEVEQLESCNAVVEVKEAPQQCYYTPEECERLITEETLVDPPNLLGKSVAVEEEEVILFKPLTRYNSAPLHGLGTYGDQMPPNESGDPIVGADECLRRATSLLIAQNQVQGEPSSIHSDLTNFKRNKLLKWQEPLVTEMVSHASLESSSSLGTSPFGSSISAGPPSLNAWVIERSSLSNERTKGKNYFPKHTLTPIEEIAAASLNDLSIKGTGDSLKYSTANHHSPAYSAPLPSAPFLPDGVGWFNGIQSAYSDQNRPSINRTNHFYDVSQGGGNTNWAISHQPLDHIPSNSGFVDGYTPFHCMTSSEWLRQYREHHNLEQPISHVWPIHSYAAGSTRNINGNDVAGSGQLDQWAAFPPTPGPLIYEESQAFLPSFPPTYGVDQQRREKLFHGYQRASPYLCGAVNEPEPLLQYLKEKEWLLQQNPTLRGPTYMGS